MKLNDGGRLLSSTTMTPTSHTAISNDKTEDKKAGKKKKIRKENEFIFVTNFNLKLTIRYNVSPIGFSDTTKHGNARATSV